MAGTKLFIVTMTFGQNLWKRKKWSAVWNCRRWLCEQEMKFTTFSTFSRTRFCGRLKCFVTRPSLWIMRCVHSASGSFLRMSACNPPQQPDIERPPSVLTPTHLVQSVLFAHTNVSVSQTSPAFFCTCRCTFTKEKFLHPQTVCKKDMDILVTIRRVILPKFLPFHSLDQLFVDVFGHALDCATDGIVGQRQSLKQSSRIFTNHNVHHITFSG